MSLNWIDLAFFLGFFAVVVGVSMYKSRAGKSSVDYFLAGRGLSWWLIGFTIVAANISTEQFVGMAGQGAGSAGLAVSAWQLTGAAGIVIIAFTFMPRFLRLGIFTMPEYLERYYHPAARAIMAVYTVVVYVLVTLTAVLYSGGLAASTIFGVDLTLSIWIFGGIAALYTTWGGLKAAAWADLFQGAALIAGGLLTMALGFRAVGGVGAFFEHNAAKLHMVLPAEHPLLPWTGILAGMWIPIFYYCGLNQFIAQRSLAAKSLTEGQLGVIFAGALWLIVPFAIVFPGIMASQLYGKELDTPDQAYPLLMRRLIPAGLRGFMFAAIAGAVVSSLASVLNSASTVFTMDLYRRHLRPDASQGRLLAMGRILTLVFVAIGCLVAPSLGHEKFKGVFNFIQEFQGYISPGILAAFLFSFLSRRAPPAAGVTALLVSAPFYGLLQWRLGEVHFLIRMMITFAAVMLLMLAITVARPLPEPRHILELADDPEPAPLAVKLCGGAVIAAVILFFIIFW